MPTRAAHAFLLALFLSGCATYSLVKPVRTPIGDHYTVEPQIAWSAARSGKYAHWTVDGRLLQQIEFVTGLDDGEPLIPDKEQHKKQVFRKGMAPSDIMELVVDSLAMDGAQKLETRNLRPMPFGTQPGFRFEARFVGKDGLEYEGLVAGAAIKDRLYLIQYSGAHAHYFSKHKQHVERMIESIEMR